MLVHIKRRIIYLVLTGLMSFVLILTPFLLQDTSFNVKASGTKKTYIINLDGMRGDYFNLTYEGPNLYNGCLTPNLVSLWESLPSALYTNCTDMLPSNTGTNHASIITSTPVGTHGIIGVGSFYVGLKEYPPDYGTAVFGRFNHTYLRVPTLFNSISTLTTAVVAGKPWVGDILQDSDCDIKVYPDNPTNPPYIDPIHPPGYILGGPYHDGDSEHPKRWYFPSYLHEPPPAGYAKPPIADAEDMPSDTWVINQTINIIENEDPDFMYILMANQDEAGHAYGALTDTEAQDLFNGTNVDATRDQLYLTDAEVGRFIQFLNQTGRLEDSLIVFTADHGMGTMKNANQTVDLREILADNGICMRADDRSVQGHYNASGIYDWLAAEGPVAYIYNVTASYLDDIENILMSYQNENGEYPIWEVLNKTEQQNAINDKTGWPFDLYCDNYLDVIWPDLIVFTKPNYPIPLYYDEIYGGVNAFMLDFPCIPRVGDADIPTVPGAHGTYSEQEVPLMFIGRGVPFNKLIVNEPVTVLDIVPTICEINNWPTPPDAEGLPLWYDVNINAFCENKDDELNVTIMKDSIPTGYKTPHTFSVLKGSHSFKVPESDPHGHYFSHWSSVGGSSTTLQTNKSGSYTAYYRTEYPPFSNWIKIGIIGPMIPLPLWSPAGMKEAAELACDEINIAGGVNVAGTPYGLELEFGDEYSFPYPNPGAAYDEFLRLLEIEGCEYIIGGFSSEIVPTLAMASEDWYEMYPHLFLINGAFGDELVDGTIPHIFRINPVNTSMLLRNIAGAVGGYMLYASPPLPPPQVATPGSGFMWSIFQDPTVTTTLGPGLVLPQVRVAVVTEDLDWTLELHTSLTNPSIYPNILGPLANVTYSVRVDPLYPDWFSIWHSVKASGADIVIHLFSGGEGIQLTSTFYDNDVEALLVGFNLMGQWQTHWTWAAGKCEYEALVSFSGTRTPIVSDVTRMFWDSFVNWTDVWPMYTAVGAYDAIYALKDAMETIGSKNKEVLIAYFEDPSYERIGLVGKFKFTSSHDVFSSEFGPLWTQGYTRMMIVQWLDGKLDVVCPRLMQYSKTWALPPWMYPLVWDTNYDKYVGIDDIVFCADKFGYDPSFDEWDHVLDVTYDDYVGINDIVEVAEHFGEST